MSDRAVRAIGEIVHDIDCKDELFGRPETMVEKFLAMAKLGEKTGMPKMRVLMEVESLRTFEEMFLNQQQSSEDMKEFENIMKGYHDLVEYGRREIYKIES